MLPTQFTYTVQAHDGVLASSTMLLTSVTPWAVDRNSLPPWVVNVSPMTGYGSECAVNQGSRFLDAIRCMFSFLLLSFCRHHRNATTFVTFSIDESLVPAAAVTNGTLTVATVASTQTPSTSVSVAISVTRVAPVMQFTPLFVEQYVGPSKHANLTMTVCDSRPRPCCMALTLTLRFSKSTHSHYCCRTCLHLRSQTVALDS